MTTKSLASELIGKVQKYNVLCTGGYKPYIKFTEQVDLIHKRLDVAGGVIVIEKVFHIQNVNAYHSRLKTGLLDFMALPLNTGKIT